jgi:hypothetical protein
MHALISSSSSFSTLTLDLVFGLWTSDLALSPRFNASTLHALTSRFPISDFAIRHSDFSTPTCSDLFRPVGTQSGTPGIPDPLQPFNPSRFNNSFSDFATTYRNAIVSRWATDSWWTWEVNFAVYDFSLFRVFRVVRG